MMSGDDNGDKVVRLPGVDEERARRLKVEVERLAHQSTTEWIYYVETPGYAEKYGVDKITLRQMVEAAVKAIEKKAREDRGEQRWREDRVERRREATKRDEERRTDREERERARRADREERERERREREERKAAERKTRERVKALAAIVKLPSARHGAELQKLARRFGEDVEALRIELDELLGDEAEKIRRGIVSPWDEPVSTRELLDAATAQIAKYVIIHDKVVAPNRIAGSWTLSGKRTPRAARFLRKRTCTAIASSNCPMRRPRTTFRRSRRMSSTISIPADAGALNATRGDDARRCVVRCSPFAFDGERRMPARSGARVYENEERSVSQPTLL